MSLKEVDSELAGLIQKEHSRQKSNLELIASNEKNIISDSIF
jgi:glycine/serine hydroxymethyltransferase